MNIYECDVKMSNWLAFAVKTNILKLLFIWRTFKIWTNQSLLYFVKLVHRHSLSPCFCLLVSSADLRCYITDPKTLKQNPPEAQSASHKYVKYKPSNQTSCISKRLLKHNRKTLSEGQPEATKMFSIKNQNSQKQFWISYKQNVSWNVWMAKQQNMS